MIHKDLFSVIQTMLQSLHEIDRVEGVVFPRLELQERNKHLQVPDAQNNKRISHYVAILDKLIPHALKSTKKELAHLKRFMYIFKSKPAGIVFSLKKRSFQVQQEAQLAEELAQQE
jgi:hypothetical protein